MKVRDRTPRAQGGLDEQYNARLLVEAAPVLGG